MALHRPASHSKVETPIERMFRRIMKRSMTKAERHWLHLKPALLIRLGAGTQKA